MRPVKSYIAKRFQNSDAGLSLDTDALARYSDIIDLSIGDTDFITDDAIIDTAFREAKAGYTHYGDPKGDPELIRSVCDAWQTDFKQPLSPDHVLVTASSSMGMALVMLSVLDPGDEVIVFSPYFSLYRTQAELAGGVCVEVPTYASEGWAIDEARLRAAITPRTKLIVFNNPCNPTGMMYSRKELEAIAKVCVDNDLYVLSDEIYYSLTYDNEQFTSLAALGEDIKARTLLINGVSKSYAMTGWRIGYIAAPANITKVIGNYLGHCTGSPSAISQKAALAALTAPQDQVETMRQAFEERRDYMVKRMNQIEGISCIKPEGAFYVMMNMEKVVGKELFGQIIHSDDDFASLFLKYGKVAVVPGGGFGAPNFIRWSYAASMDNIKAGLDRLEMFLQGKAV